MNGCIYRTKDDECDLYAEGGKYTAYCDMDNCKGRKMSNADRIRGMTDEELDKFLGEVQWDVANYCGGITQKQEYPFPEQRGAWLNWLREEAKGGE